jgi:glutamate-1-semialdehyde 2,1-aminomutase
VYGVTPDLCAIGKAISGGLPLGVLCGREDIMAIANPKRRLQMLPYSMQTGTFSSNPVCASVAVALIEELEKPGVYQRLEEVGRRVREGLRDAIAHAGIEASVTGVPSVFEIWFTKDEPYDHQSSKGSDFYKNIRFSDLLLQQGVSAPSKRFMWPSNSLPRRSHEAGSRHRRLREHRRKRRRPSRGARLFGSGARFGHIRRSQGGFALGRSRRDALRQHLQRSPRP